MPRNPIAESPEMPLRRVSTEPTATLRERDDTALVAGLARGEVRALDELISRYADRLCSFLERIVRDGGWADDLVQEAVVRVYDGAHSYDPAWPVRVWLFRIARNLAVDLMRREGSMRNHLQQIVPREDAPSTVATVEHREFQAQLEDAIRTLPEGFRSVFLLRENENLSYEEIGEILNISVKTVSSRLHRSRLQLKEQLKRYLDS